MKKDENRLILQKDMHFGALVELYLDAVSSRIKIKSYVNKKSIIKKYVLPYFENMCIGDITPKEIGKWQDEMSETVDPKTGRPYAGSYIKTMHGHLMAVLNYAGEYDKSSADAETGIWEPEQYRQFAETMMDKPLFFYAFEVMYWSGLSGSELLALTLDDVYLSRRELSVTESLEPHSRDEDVDPEKQKSITRYVALPGFLSNELKDYIDYIYMPAEDGRLFPVSKIEMIYELKKGTEKAGLPGIKLSGLRQSHIYLLLDQGFSLHDAEERTGIGSCEGSRHDNHDSPSKQADIANRLDKMMWGWFRS